MVSRDFTRSMANGYLFLTNILNTVTIDKVIVPELVQIGNSSDVILDCQYSVIDERFTVLWLFNRSDDPIYQWSPRTDPKVGGLLEGRVDLLYKASSSYIDERRAIRIVKLDPELSGEYTCSVITDGTEARQTKSMLVFSPEKELVLDLQQDCHHDVVKIKCTARGLYPQPDLILEHNHKLIPRQQQRVWRSNGMLYDVECKAHVRREPQHHSIDKVLCRLQLPQADYTVTKESIYTRSTIEKCDTKLSRSPSLNALFHVVMLSVLITFDLC